MDDSQLLLDLEKRLPTLPNTPSSAYPPSMAGEVDEPDEAQDNANLQSHFSCTTVDTEPRTDSYLHANSRFSDWTDAPIRLSPQSEYATSMLDFESVSPPPELSLDPRPDEQHHDDSRHDLLSISKQDGLPSASSFSTVTSVASSAAPSTHDGLDSAKSGHFSWSKFQHYSLPTEEAGSGTTLKPTSNAKQAVPLVVENPHPDVYQPQSTGGLLPTIPHSSSMQQLLNELSYLGDMIQQH